jgi:iron complex outermembrane recepter protein
MPSVQSKSRFETLNINRKRNAHVKLRKLSVVIPALFIAAPIYAQTAEQPQTIEKIEVTGSSIKRIVEEGALPVQVITKEEIARAGITSAEQLVARIAANGSGSNNLASQVGIQLTDKARNNNGNSTANLRGIGDDSTLVLLNGRRVALHGAKGYAVDLNSIPLAAVERVEVLKDGASSLYGTDAIGGVINFILRKDFRGSEVSAFLDVTQDGGGNIWRVNGVTGFGDLTKDRFNFIGSISYDEQAKLTGAQRSFSNGNQPLRGLSTDTTGTPFATQTGRAGSAIGASYKLPGDAQAYTRANLLAFQGKCASIPGMAPYEYILNDFAAARYGCTFDTGSTAVLQQPNERLNGVARATFALAPQTTAFVEGVFSRSLAKKTFEPYQLTTTGVLAAGWYPVGGPYYQDLSAFIPGFDKTKPIAYRWRCLPCGNRQIDTTSDSFRILAGLEGSFGGGWDYKLGISTGESKANSILGDGYFYTPLLAAALGSGKINPFSLDGSQTPEALALLNSAKATGENLFGGKSGLLQADGLITGEVYKLPAGMISVAAGFDVREENYAFVDGSGKAAAAINGAPFDPDFPKVKRRIAAVFTEALIPIVKGLEATLAVRHDNYSDFGGTTNPKASFRWSPNSALVVRGSAGTGFRAPSFYQVYGTTTESQIPGNIADPILCPQNPGNPVFCAIRPNGRSGGNLDVKPEKSKQWSVGAAFSPIKSVSATVDLWEIKRTDKIYALTPQEVIANYTLFPGALVRGTDGRLDGPGGYIRAGLINAAGDVTRGIDLSLDSSFQVAGGRIKATLDGTYMIQHKERRLANEDFNANIGVGLWSTDTIFPRWKHNLTLGYDQGPWNFSLSQYYTHSYKDELPYGPPPAGYVDTVKAYITYGLSASYKGIKNLTINAGVKNLLNTDPPFTAHNYDFAGGAGWDPRIADPRGRAFTLGASYKF